MKKGLIRLVSKGSLNQSRILGILPDVDKMPDDCF